MDKTRENSGGEHAVLPLGMSRLEWGFLSRCQFVLEKQLQKTNENSESFWLVLGISTNLQLLLFLKGIIIIGLS